MYLIFFWVKRKKKKKKTSVLGEGCSREEADTYQRHEAQRVSRPRRAVLSPSGIGAPTAEWAGAGTRGGRMQVEGTH